MQAFWLSLGMIFIAEMGDKTQLVALTLATRFSAWVTLAGIFTATLIVHVFSVAIGGFAGEFLPTEWIKLIAGLAFIGFGFWTLKGDSLDDEGGGKPSRSRLLASPFMIVTTTFFLAELGDKTMLSTVTLAATHSIIPVWLGSTLGMVIADGLAIVVGTVLGSRLPERAIKVGAAGIFFAFGLFSSVQGLLRLPPVLWAAAIGSVAFMGYLYAKAVAAAPGRARQDAAAADAPAESMEKAG